MTLFKLLLLLLFLMIIASVVNNLGNQALSQTLGGNEYWFYFPGGLCGMVYPNPKRMYSIFASVQ